MVTYTLDTNCFIDAVNVNSQSYEAVQTIFTLADSGRVSLKVSPHSLHELEARKDKAYNLAKGVPKLTHWPVGSWIDQVSTWEQLDGSWTDSKLNDEIQTQLGSLAKAGTDIRDRGAFVDALRGGVDRFVTSDRQLVGNGPSARINRTFTTRVVTPEQAVVELCV